jgi:hypothetical protein
MDWIWELILPFGCRLRHCKFGLTASGLLHHHRKSEQDRMIASTLRLIQIHPRVQYLHLDRFCLEMERASQLSHISSSLYFALVVFIGIRIFSARRWILDSISSGAHSEDAIGVQDHVKLSTASGRI